ncbi:MAG: hypothetical protein HWQ41_11555 [Nostoc sp. NOS(2021)]|nr:hypothetical protein [Nostoc sp. NOS(2021)]
MEPNLVTDPKILNIMNELIQLEPIFPTARSHLLTALGNNGQIISEDILPT